MCFLCLNILECIHRDDVEALKQFRNYPNLFQIKDVSARPILHIAISENKVAVFDFLLSLDDYPIDTGKYNNQTALEFAICSNPHQNEHFAYSLLKKGARIDFSYRFNLDSLLHQAIRKGYSKVTQFLIEKGANLYCRGQFKETPLSLIFESNDVNETLAMLLYSGVDPLIPDFNGCRVVDFVFRDGRLSEQMLEHLIFYLFDNYWTGFDMPLTVLFDLLQLESPLIPQILNHITSVNLDLQEHLGRNLTMSYKLS